VPEPLDFARDDPDGPRAPAPGNPSPAPPHRRFAALIGHASSTRKVDPTRLAWAITASLAILTLLGFGGSKLFQSLSGYVASRREYQIDFARIELDPEPEPYLRGGVARILEMVRRESGHPATLPLLDLDLDRFADDFRRCPWVRKVERVDRPYGRLVIHLAYHSPVAVVVDDRDRDLVISEDAVVLPKGDIDWSDRNSYRAPGLTSPLIAIRGLAPHAPEIRFGVPWKTANPADPAQPGDPRVATAARLAAFLLRQPRTTSPGTPMPEFALIVPDDSREGFFVRTADQTWIHWGLAPGSEALGTLTAQQKWEMLARWVDQHPGERVDDPEYLAFRRSGVVKLRGSRSQSAGGSGKSAGRPSH
jgi:hypothetical protein